MLRGARWGIASGAPVLVTAHDVLAELPIRFPIGILHPPEIRAKTERELIDLADGLFSSNSIGTVEGLALQTGFRHKKASFSCQNTKNARPAGFAEQGGREVFVGHGYFWLTVCKI
jgi:hypothetical protein